jgi:putative tryptophan/tyrosine transport system substrate-binding protein
VRRRNFLTLLGGAAAAWPVAARAQAMPVVGYLGSGSPDLNADQVAAFRKGMSESGFVEGKNLAIDFRWAEGRYDRLPALAAELVRRQVTVILASGGTLPTNAAKAATTTIPIVFLTATDPVATGLVPSLNRPGGNVTGVNFFADEVTTKQLGLLRDMVPEAKVIALLVNKNGFIADSVVTDVQTAARSHALQVRVLRTGTEHDIDEVFAGFVQQRPDALLVQSEPFLGGQRRKIASMATRQMIPTISSARSFAEAGGLISYGASGPDAYHQAALYVGRILKGEKPADLPVMQSTKFELVINLKTAKTLGLTIPPSLLAITDEVIE